MTVAELIEKLKELPQDAVVVHEDNEQGYYEMVEAVVFARVIRCYDAEGRKKREISGAVELR